jgi:hypothetical protein
VCILRLKQGDVLLGTLTDVERGQGGDKGRFVPTEAFFALKPLFDREWQAMEGGSEELAYALMDEIERLKLVIENEAGEVLPALMHINGDVAYFWY